ncbi:hypothetical protein EON79_17010, partial [bacterium]
MLGYRGGRYVWDTANLLLAPGVPIQVKLKTPGGTVKARAESYAIDVRKGTAWVADASVTDPQGVILAKVRRVNAVGLDALRGADQVVKVRVSDVYARIERDKKGFDFERYLPPSDGQPSKVPFEVDVVRGRATFLDNTESVPWKREFATDRVRVSGLGDDLVVKGTVRAEGVGTVPMRVQKLPGGLSLTGVLPKLDPTDLIQRFAEVPALKEIGWSKLLVSGPVRAWLPAKGANFDVSLAAEVSGLTYREYRADSVRFDGTVNTKGLVGLVKAQDGATRATFDGSVRF